MRRIFLLFLCGILVMLPVLITGCGSKQRDPNKVMNYLKDLKSYSSDMHISVKNDRQTLEYDAKQVYLKGIGYRLELGKDRIFTYRDDRIYVTDLNNGINYSTDNNFDSLFRLSFIGEYVGLMYTNEDIRYSYKNINDINYQLTELTIPGRNRNISKAVLYDDTKDNLPWKIKIYDINDKERYEITYYNFIPNCNVKPELFKLACLTEVSFG